MNAAYSVVRPELNEWSELPLRPASVRQMVVACLICFGTTAVAFIADRGWESFEQDAWTGSYRIIDMWGLSALLIATVFSVIGWAFGRFAVAMVPLILVYAAVPHSIDGYASAPFWWAGALLATAWLLVQASNSVRQVRAVRKLAARLDKVSTMPAGPNAGAALRRHTRRSAYWALGLSLVAGLGWMATFLVLPGELGRTYAELGESPCSDFFAAAAVSVSMLAIIQWVRWAWRVASRLLVGTFIWRVPKDLGPVRGLRFRLEGETGRLPLDVARTEVGCTCIEEYLRSDPDEAEDAESLDRFDIPASCYCAVHGIDQINALTPEQFRSNATAMWFWDEDSIGPVDNRPDADRGLLLGYAGHAFTGLPVHVANGVAEVSPFRDDLADERDSAFTETNWDRPQPPLGGVIDRIDLQPVGLRGEAIRYSHGRPWFEEYPHNEKPGGAAG